MSTVQLRCMNNIEHRLLIHGKYNNLVQVVLYGGPSHFRGVTVLNGRYIMYDGIRAFGKERNRVKYLGGNTPFNTRGNDYEKIAAYNREGQKKKARLSLGIHVGKVSEKG
jgi:hypothetical protein